MTTIPELNEQLVAASMAITAAQTRLDEAVTRSAKARHEYRAAKARAYLQIKADVAASGRKATVDEMNALVDEACGAERFEAYLAEGLEYAAKQAHRAALESQSSLQTRANMIRDEIRLARSGTEVHA